MAKDPKISVVLTSHKKWPLLRIAVESVLMQTFSDLELIVVDDDSQDAVRRQ
jgi:glycosyltransferase involved in cell wall biosynthesis